MKATSSVMFIINNGIRIDYQVSHAQANRRIARRLKSANHQDYLGLAVQNRASYSDGETSETR